MVWNRRSKDDFNKSAALLRAYYTLDWGTIESLQGKGGVKTDPEMLMVACGLGYPDLVQKCLDNLKDNARANIDHLKRAVESKNWHSAKILITHEKGVQPDDVVLDMVRATRSKDMHEVFGLLWSEPKDPLKSRLF